MPIRGYTVGVFVFFSNRAGCVGSLLISALLTLVLFGLMRACNHA